MSNRFKIKTRPIKVKKVKKNEQALHTSFNIFTENGKNKVVTSEKPMTLAEARYVYKALAISAND